MSQPEDEVMQALARVLDIVNGSRPDGYCAVKREDLAIVCALAIASLFGAMVPDDMVDRMVKQLDKVHREMKDADNPKG